MRTFTIEQANATLPLVRAIVSDWVDLSVEVAERRQRVTYLLKNRQKNENDPYWQELAAMETSLEEDSLRLRGFVDELRQVGVQPASDVDGIVDFPAVIDGRKAFLSWKLGEPEILYWHEAESKSLVRRPLTAEASAPANDRGSSQTA